MSAHSLPYLHCAHLDSRLRNAQSSPYLTRQAICLIYIFIGCASVRYVRRILVLLYGIPRKQEDDDDGEIEDEVRRMNGRRIQVRRIFRRFPFSSPSSRSRSAICWPDVVFLFGALKKNEEADITTDQRCLARLSGSLKVI